MQEIKSLNWFSYFLIERTIKQIVSGCSVAINK